MKTSHMIQQKKEEILKLARHHGVKKLKLFGSTARGEEGPESDVDFLVEAGSKRSPFFPGGLVADLEELLGRKVDVVEPDALHWKIRDHILKESIPL